MTILLMVRRIEMKDQFSIKLKKEMDRYMIGQNEYKMAIATAIDRHIKFGKRNHILAFGPTGSGKTFIFHGLEKSKLIPEDYTIMIANVSRITEEGYKGQDIESIFENYARLCRKNHDYKYKGIICIDETDKVVAQYQLNDRNGESGHNAMLQYQLMQILDGGMIANIPTDNILFVFCGVFDGLNHLDEYHDEKKIGFSADTSMEKTFINEEATIREKLISIGFQREFLGRISQIVEVEKLTKAEIKAILLHPTRGILAELEDEFMVDGIEVDITDEAVEAMTNAIVSENLGARSARNVLESILPKARFYCMENEYNKIIIDEEAVFKGIPKYEKITGSKFHDSITDDK